MLTIEVSSDNHPHGTLCPTFIPMLEYGVDPELTTNTIPEENRD